MSCQVCSCPLEAGKAGHGKYSKGDVSVLACGEECARQYKVKLPANNWKPGGQWVTVAEWGETGGVAGLRTRSYILARAQYVTISIGTENMAPGVGLNMMIMGHKRDGSVDFDGRPTPELSKELAKLQRLLRKGDAAADDNGVVVDGLHEWAFANHPQATGGFDYLTPLYAWSRGEALQ